MKVPIWNSWSQRKRKLTLWALGLFLFYIVAGFLILPPIVRSIAAKQLSQQLDREVSIAQVKINPLAFSTTVRGLLIKDKDGQPFVSWDEVYVHFQPFSSLFTGAYTFKEISTTKPYVRVQMNPDDTFNFSDLLVKFSTNAPSAKPAKASKPLLLRVAKLHIAGAEAAYADFTTREPFRRTLGPLDITLDNFRTDPDNKNPYAFTGTTDAGERISWSGFFYLDPLRSQGALTLDNFTLNKYAALYQDLVRFEIRSGSMGVHVNYQFEFSPTNHLMVVKNSAFALRDFKLGVPGDTNDLVELKHFAVTGAGANLQNRQATVDYITAMGANLQVMRNKDQTINMVEVAKPSATATNAPGGIVFLLRSVTNVVAMLLESTNQWGGTVNTVDVTNCALHLEDEVNSRPARLDLTDIQFEAKNLSNLPGTNLTADLSLRWNTNGSIKIATTAAFLPPTADVQMDFDQLDLGTLDPYLEPKLNLFILGSKVGLHGKVSLTTPSNALPQVTFHGDASLEGFRTVDGDWAEDLLKWDAVRFQGIDANLNPQSATIKEIDVDGAYARLVIETNRTINLLNALRMTNSPATNQPEVAAKSEAATTNSLVLPQISVGIVVITNTMVSFTDRSLSPEVNMAIQEIQGSVADISSEQMQHAVVDLGAKVEGVGPAAITGVINPLNGALTNNIKVSVKDMDLTPFGSYAGKYAGYRIAQGKLNLDLDYTLVGNNLDSKNVITLNQFTFGEKVESPEATHLPVRLAIAILKDREGKIVLDVPIGGSVNDPQFHIGKVVTRAIENILVKVATSPFSLLGAVFGGGGEELGYQEFNVGSAALKPEETKKLDSLLKGMYERPGLNLAIAGSVDPDGDREGLQRAAVDKEIRTRLWKKLRKSEQATNTVDQIILTPEQRTSWVAKLYGEALAAGKITPDLIAANTNLAVFSAQVAVPKSVDQKAATWMKHSLTAEELKQAQAAYKTKLNPPPDANEALLLATIPITDADLETLAAARAKAVQDYLLASGKVEAGRLFLTAKGAALRQDGSRAYLQFQ